MAILDREEFERNRKFGRTILLSNEYTILALSHAVSILTQEIEDNCWCESVVAEEGTGCLMHGALGKVWGTNDT